MLPKVESAPFESEYKNIFHSSHIGWNAFFFLCEKRSLTSGVHKRIIRSKDSTSSSQMRRTFYRAEENDIRTLRLVRRKRHKTGIKVKSFLKLCCDQITVAAVLLKSGHVLPSWSQLHRGLQIKGVLRRKWQV